MCGMRRLVAGPTLLALLFAFWGSPFFHLHPVDERIHHDGAAIAFDHEALIHAHLPRIAPAHTTTSVSDTEEIEIPIDIFRAVTTPGATLALPFLAPARAALTLPEVSSVRAFLPSLPRAHDPPSLSQLIPRAPPA
jgi:hypothetical protein